MAERNWQQDIEKRIRHMQDPHCRYSMKCRFEDAEVMQALLDVAVATQWYLTDAAYKAPEQAADGISVLREALAKLEEKDDD